MQQVYKQGSTKAKGEAEQRARNLLNRMCLSILRFSSRRKVPFRGTKDCGREGNADQGRKVANGCILHRTGKLKMEKPGKGGRCSAWPFSSPIRAVSLGGCAALHAGTRILLAKGGSAADAQHLAGELRARARTPKIQEGHIVLGLSIRGLIECELFHGD